jgi:3',5'-cyclic AMP phosphodiesterase CpdA
MTTLRDDLDSGTVAPGLALRRAGRRLFGFAVIADSHLEPEAAGLALPRSNRRNRDLVAALAPRRPAFVLHLGDIVHPVPQAPGHVETMGLARELYAGLGAPLLWTPGNHDIGDKPNDAMPAATVTEDWLGEYRRQFGAPWQLHRHGEVDLLLLNSPILNSGYAVEREQRRWFERALADARGRRVFVATHYPPFLVSPDEPGHYDNIDRPAREWLLELLARHRVEALFCGHVHTLFWNRLGATECYLLPSPSFVRRDYSEIHRVRADDEYGRNDVGKLGCFWVDVYEEGHVARFLRTGTDLADGAAPHAPLVLPAHPKDPGGTPFGVTLRHPWSELTELPHNPPVDEFARRVVRNDWPVQALWDMGIRALRAPVGDLASAAVRARIADLVALGHRFTFFSAGVPDAGLLALMRAHAALVARWECVLPGTQLGAWAEAVAPMARETGIALAWADLRSAAIGNAGKPAGKHFTAPGFLPTELDAVEAGLARLPAGLVSAVCFRVARDALHEPEVQALDAFARRAAVGCVLTWSLMPDGPNDAAMDAGDVRDRVERLCALADRYPGVEWVLDGFVDVDRGYYPRVALVDRLGNLRAAGEWLRRRRALT